ncbi:MAG: response regulator transcription factor, partial [Actinomycetota bacterium]
FHTALEVNEAFQSGAAAFVSKSAGFLDLIEVVRRVISGEGCLYLGGPGEKLEVLPPPESDDDETWRRLMTLTVREIEVLSLLSFAPVEKVARTLSISLGTLRNHISNILRKTGARSQIEAIDVARRVGLIDS